MHANVGTTDRIIRFVVAAIAVVLALVVGAGSVGGIVLLVAGGIMVVTGVVGFCPLYRLVGVNTCRVRHHQA